MQNKITIVLVTFRSSLEILKNCLTSINSSIPIIIVDNSSSLKIEDLGIKDINNYNLKIIHSNNVGNGEGINIGVKNAITDFVLYLDVDTEINIDTINELNSIANEHKDWAVIAPMIKDKIYKNQDYIKCLHHSIHEIFEMNFVEGAIMLINKKNTFFNGITFDKKIFLYWEENDFFFQCKKNNKKILMVKSLLAKHVGNSSTGYMPSLEIELNRNWHYMWSKFYFFKKNFSYFTGIKKTFKNFFSSLIKFLFFSFINKKKSKIYFYRFQGLLHSYLGETSWRRPR